MIQKSFNDSEKIESAEKISRPKKIFRDFSNSVEKWKMTLL